jgi:hypothetical protein
MQQPNTDPWQLAMVHRYADALAAYDAEPVTGSAPRVANRAIVLLCLRRWQEAFDELSRANAIKSEKTKGLQPYLTKMATAQWLMGNRHGAIETLRRSVDGIVSGDTRYGDSAGGMSQGLLLWYAGVASRNFEAQRHALAYLLKLSEGRRAGSWPGPVALCVLGTRHFEELPTLVTGEADIEKSVAVGRVDILKRRRLCQVLFYSAVMKRDRGDAAGCQRGMRQCYELENPLLEEEWYLARAEVEAGVAR